VSRRHQAGAALLLALVVTALSASLASIMLFRGELNISRTQQLTRQAQAWQLAAGMEDWAMTVLDRDREITPLWDGPDDIWARALPPTEIPGGHVSGSLTDLSGRFNINSLLGPDGTDNPVAVRRFRRLTETVLQLDAAITNQVLDYLDADATPRQQGFEAPASQPGVRLLQHKSELRQLPAINQQAWARLAPLICALPPLTRININTAPIAVLMSLAPGISRDVALQLQPRTGAPYESVSQFLAQAAISEQTIDPTGLSVHAAAFLARAQVDVDDTALVFYSVILRGGTSADSSYHVRNRSMTLP
jgi:general secretion pathway protein K